MTQFTYIHVNSSDIYTLPQFRVKNNEIISTKFLWNNLLSNIAEYYQFYLNENFVFDFLLKKTMFTDSNVSYGSISNVNGQDVYILRQDGEYYMLPGIQPRKPSNTQNVVGYDGPASSGDDVGCIATLNYGHNRTRFSKIVFSIFGSYIFRFLFGDKGSSPEPNASLFTGSGYGPVFISRTTPKIYNNSTLSTFASQCYQAINRTRHIDCNSEKNDLVISFGFGVDGGRYHDNIVIDNIMNPMFENYPSYQMLTLNVSTTTYDVCVGNPNGSYYFIPKHTSTTLIIPNPVLTITSFGNTRYYYMFVGDLEDAVIKVWVPKDGDCSQIDSNIDDYVLIIHSIETIPDAREIINSYTYSRTMQLVDFMFTVLIALNYFSPVFIHYWNLVTSSLGLEYIITKVFWEMTDTTFVELYEAIHTDSVIN